MNFYHLTLYAAATAAVIVIEHLTIGRLWRRNEAARRVVGHATILVMAAFFVPLGLIDLNTLIAITTATGVGGVIIGFVQVNEGEKRKEERAEVARKVINGEENTRQRTGRV